MPSTLGIHLEGMRCVAGDYVFSSLDVFCFNFILWPSFHVADCDILFDGSICAAIII